MGPWLQQPASDSVVVMWETEEPTRGVVRYGSAAGARQEVRSDAAAKLHEVRLSGLTPGAACAYEVEATTADGRRLASAPATFVPAPLPGAPVCFAVVGDTQDQPAVWRRVAARVYAERPAFLLHCGDIVGDGHDPRAWREEFFAPARALLAHVPFLAVLGNHEGDSPLYYRYVSNPAPEHRCALRYGDVEVLLVDSERPLEAGSEQHGWLARVLRASTAVWKVVVVHRPPWSSDRDDYGDACLARAAPGDPRTRVLIPLLEEHGVDLLFCGHVHDYERTWPLREGQVDEERGVTYVQTGGAGGYAGDARPGALLVHGARARVPPLRARQRAGRHARPQGLRRRRPALRPLGAAQACTAPAPPAYLGRRAPTCRAPPSARATLRKGPVRSSAPPRPLPSGTIAPRPPARPGAGATPRRA